ncbi:M3 family metallopeptidase [Burkholderia ambifaria]|uniref:M3 family metallopeptidase n=1 Tax=Burkholderia ambifaria TaxID=152480 RepID=UPI001E62E788|nr:M3 family metallopeptidase [Burkholderia ambifaria]UEP26276.1 M3 family metallopeptidase [Burkholderia ambifaria]
MHVVNPLLDRSQLPCFEAIRARHVRPAVDACLLELDNAIEQAGAAPRRSSWTDVIEPICLAIEALEYTWGIVTHLVTVRDSAALRAAYGECVGLVSSALSRFRQDTALLGRYQAVVASDAFATLSAGRQQVLRNLIRDALLAGAELPPGPRTRLNCIRERQALLAKTFQDNIADATRAYSYRVTADDELAGLPDHVRIAARAAARQCGRDGHLFTLDFSSYHPVMQFSECRALRERLYRARSARASELGEHYADGAAAWDNMPVMTELLALRHEEAQLLGHRDFAGLSLAQKMARSAECAQSFLDDLHRRIRPQAAAEWQALQSFARDGLGIRELQPWDLPFAMERLRKQRFGVSTDEVRRYFPEQAVLHGLFKLVETLFDIKVLPVTGSVWHEDVRLYRLDDARGHPVSHLYLDLYARPGKRDGAWAASGGSRGTRADGTIRLPAAYLMCNVAAAEPACFAFEQVVTLFHEMGHCLHHMLTDVTESAVSGAKGVEWDAVEFPSQFMEQFCREWEVLVALSAHVETGAALPRTLFDRMLAARRVDHGIEMAHQIALSALDLQLHSERAMASNQSILHWVEAIHQAYEATPPDPLSRSVNTFGHIFAGDYAAAYYSYQWAKVLAADAYAALENAGATHANAGRREIGKRYRTEILGPGGSRPAMESFIAFRGRAPDLDALFRDSVATRH